MRERTPFDEVELAGDKSHIARSKKYGPVKPKGKFKAGRPQQPADLTPEEVVVWEKTIKILADQNTLTASDGPALELYVRIFCEHARESKKLADEGRVYITQKLDRHGYSITIHAQNPRSRVVDCLHKQLVTLLRELSLFPARRSRVALTVEPTDEVSEGQRLLLAANEIMGETN